MTIDEREIARLDAFAQWCKEKSVDPTFSSYERTVWRQTYVAVKFAQYYFDSPIQVRQDPHQ